MRKFIYIIITLSVIGAALSILLTVEYYYPDLNFNIAVSCGDKMANPCATIAQSGYSSFLGIPVSICGLLFYLFFLFTALIADYAYDKYCIYSIAVLLPLSILSLLINLVLTIILITESMFCIYCIMTYITNILIFTTLIFWFKSVKSKYIISFAEAVKLTFKIEENNHDRKAAFSLFTVFTFLLIFAVFSANYILRIKTYSPEPSREKIAAFVKELYSSKPIKLHLPESSMIVGNPNAPVSVVIFTDFLCSACYHLFLAEKQLFLKHRDRIKLIYYNYPLDSACNENIEKAVYKNSCIASRALITSSLLNEFDRYLVTHFRNYKKFHGNYNINTSLEIALNYFDRDGFLKKMNSEKTGEIIKRDIDIAQKLGIDATPTIFINGRKIVGVPPVELLSAIIERESAGD